MRTATVFGVFLFFFYSWHTSHFDQVSLFFTTCMARWTLNLVANHSVANSNNSAVTQWQQTGRTLHARIHALYLSACVYISFWARKSGSNPRSRLQKCPPVLFCESRGRHQVKHRGGSAVRARKSLLTTELASEERWVLLFSHPLISKTLGFCTNEGEGETGGGGGRGGGGGEGGV